MILYIFLFLGFVGDATMPILNLYLVMLFFELSMFQRFVACPFSARSLILKPS